MDDLYYSHFPYDAKVTDDETFTIGQNIYNRLSRSYNQADFNDNTVVIYNVGGYLNADQAGLCIVNYFTNITDQLKKMHCFSGDRVGVLVQENGLPESMKDSETGQTIWQNEGEVILIGINQATYLTYIYKIRSDEFDKGEENETKEFVKEFRSNRGMMMLPKKPVYVERVQNGIQYDIFGGNQSDENTETNADIKAAKELLLNKYYCLYHMMLQNLKYTNQLLIDISNNPHQSLFWLGVAHGADVNAIAVKRRETKEEREKRLKENCVEDIPERYLFDVSGLWTALFESQNIDGFYKQLELVQKNIEFHSKLMLQQNSSFDCEPPKEVKDEKSKHEKLESFYRNRFWKAMLMDNQLCVYLNNYTTIKTNNANPSFFVSKWDMDSASQLSSYLSKRTVIGGYQIVALDGIDKSEKNTNASADGSFICIGSNVNPMTNDHTLVDSINDKYPEIKLNKKETLETLSKKSVSNNQESILQIKGFKSSNNSGIFTQHPCLECYLSKKKDCENCGVEKDHDSNKEVLFDRSKKDFWKKCLLNHMEKGHTEIAQLVLWRENNNCFRVAINGSSGPATKALTTLLIDNTQKQEIMTEYQSGEGNQLLNNLQKTLRAEFIEKCNTEWEKNNDLAEYISPAKQYLKSVLYQYFLPFLSKQDQKRLCNSLEYFLLSLRAHKNGFEKTNEEICGIVRVLKELLEEFRGVEAFFGVEVSIESKISTDYKDTRKINNITSIDKEHHEFCVNCLFVKR